MKLILKNIWLILLVIGFTACNEDFLEIPVLVNPSPDSVDPATAVTTAYSMNITGNASGYPNIRWKNWQGFIQGDALSDDAFKGGSSPGDQPGWRELEVFEGGSGSTQTANFWEVQYKKIYVANWALSMIEESTTLPQALKNRYKGELIFLRSLNYFWLNRAYGGVSPVFGIGEEPSKRASEADIYRRLEADLKTAITFLPDEYGDADLGRATKGAAKTLLAKIYLYQQKYQECFDMTAEIIQSGVYDLEDDFMRIWDRGWVSAGDNEFGKESIFEFTSAPTPEETNPSDMINAQRPRQGEFGLTAGWGVGTPTLDLLDAFETGDPRIVSTFLFHGDSIYRETINFAVDANNQANGANEHYMFSRKVIKPLSEAPEDNVKNNGDNVIIFRYADVLLMYAESANEIGNTSEALAKLNDVRRRARNSSRTDRADIRPFINFGGKGDIIDRPFLGYDWEAVPAASILPDVTVTDKTALRTIIWNERRVELALEGERFYDLVRQSKVVPNRVGNVMRSFAAKWNNEKGANFINGIHELLPIPQAEIDVLGSEMMPQNYGY